MKILLINAGFPDYKGKDLFPAGLAYLAAAAKKYGEVKVIDMNVQKFDKNIFETFKPDITGISSTSPTFKVALEIASIAKKYSKVIIGGTHASFLPEEALEICDIVVKGEGEETISEILQGKPFSSIKGISYKENEKIIENTKRPLSDVDNLPIPAYELFNLKNYEVMSVVSSRGCPFCCDYCAASGFWEHTIRYRSIDKVIEEIKYLKSLGINTFKFHDSTFNLKEERVLEFCKKIKPLEMKWSCEIRPDFLTDCTAKAMSESGCIKLFIGVDSGSEEILKNVNRTHSIQSVINTFDLARKYDILTRAYVVFGLPGETEKTTNETIELLKKIKPYEVMLSLAVNYPGNKLKGKTLVIDEEWIKKFTGHGMDSNIFLSDSLTKKEYIRLADHIWKEIKKINHVL